MPQVQVVYASWFVVRLGFIFCKVELKGKNTIWNFAVLLMFLKKTEVGYSNLHITLFYISPNLLFLFITLIHLMSFPAAHPSAQVSYLKFPPARFGVYLIQFSRFHLLILLQHPPVCHIQPITLFFSCHLCQSSFVGLPCTKKTASGTLKYIFFF